MQTSYSGLLVRLAFLLLVFHTSAFGAEDLFTPEHVARLQGVISMEVSPDGEHVAYALSVPRIPFKDNNGPAWAELHVVDMKGVSRSYIGGEENVDAIHWTPDGESISFLAKRGKDEHRSLYVIPLNGGEARKVLSHVTDITEYQWGPDGKRIAFLAQEEESKDKKKLREKGLDQEIFEEEMRFVRVWIGQPDIGNDADDESKPQMMDLPGSASNLQWDSNDSLLSVLLAPTPLIDDDYMQRTVHIVDVEGARSIVAINTEGKLGSVRWSPDGKNLAIVGSENINDPSAGRLLLASASNETVREMLPDYQGHVTAIAWEDEHTIRYLGDKGCWTELGAVNIASGGQKIHIPAGKSVLSGLSLSRDGQTTVMLGQNERHPNEIYVLRSGDSAPRRLTFSNPWLNDMRFAEQEVITHTARDGLQLEGILIRPLDEQPDSRYPLIMYVHGGPEAHNRNGWLTSYAQPGQVAAAQGYAVFYPNYRASTGRGVEFSKLDHGDPAGKEFDDLVDAVDHLIEIGLVDRAKVGVTGGSYGGYATAWCSTFYSDRFAAGVMFVGISNLLSKFGTTDIPNEITLVHWRKSLWDDWDLFLERSPVYHVEKARTPLLILGGKDDTRVHPGQSMELYRTMKVLNKAPVRLVRYPGEGHGNRKAGGRYDYNLRLMRWMNHYLKGPGGNPPPPDMEYALNTADERSDQGEAAEESE